MPAGSFAARRVPFAVTTERSFILKLYPPTLRFYLGRWPGRPEKEIDLTLFSWAERLRRRYITFVVHKTP
jgi:hypothetical protein